MNKALVCGAGGFIGSHLVKRLKSDGYWVRGVDLKLPDFSETFADDFMIGDLRDQHFVSRVIDQHFNEVYQLAADMGGAGYIFTGENDADVMHNSATINLNVLDASYRRNIKNIFYSSSACMYPEHNQLDPQNPNCREDSAYPANPDSEYGWEKLFSERLYLAYNRNHGMNCRVARYHNIFGQGHRRPCAHEAERGRPARLEAQASRHPADPEKVLRPEAARRRAGRLVSGRVRAGNHAALAKAGAPAGLDSCSAHSYHRPLSRPLHTCLLRRPLLAASNDACRVTT